ncbi:MAG: hypothetical protein R3F65_00455 [bacterium]
MKSAFCWMMSVMMGSSPLIWSAAWPWMGLPPALYPIMTMAWSSLEPPRMWSILVET